MTLAEKVSPAHTAVLIIDMQKDYCCEGGSFDRRGFDTTAARELAPRLNLFLDKTRKALGRIVHIKMTKIAALASEANAEHYRRLGLKRVYDPSYSEFFEIVPLENEIIIPKHSYSAFHDTYLDQYLRSNGVKTLVLTGIATNVCVEAAARDAFVRDYHVVVPRDLTEGSSPDAKEASLKNIDLFFGEVIDSAVLLDCWGGRESNCQL
jgi:ureidoacrylate peracid hydrolase